MLASHILGTLIALAVIVAIFVILIVIAYFWARHDNKHYASNRKVHAGDIFTFDNGWGFAAGIAAVFGGLAIVAVILSLIPFDSKYWTLEEHSGQIETIDVRVVNSGSESVSLTGQYAIVLAGDNEVIVADDPRLQTYSEGDDITLICGWQWVYAGSDVLNCNLQD